MALKIRAKDRPQSVKELQKALEGTCDKEENKKEIKPLIFTPIKEEEVLKNKNISKKENIEKKSIFFTYYRNYSSRHSSQHNRCKL